VPVAQVFDAAPGRSEERINMAVLPVAVGGERIDSMVRTRARANHMRDQGSHFLPVAHQEASGFLWKSAAGLCGKGSSKTVIPTDGVSLRYFTPRDCCI
jgi:hypothetical protein